MANTAVRPAPGIFEELAGRYPLTVAAFSTMPGGDPALRAVVELERRWIALNSQEQQGEPFRYAPTERDLPACPPENSYDAVIAGGGLGLVAGAALAKRGLRVLVFDRDKAGSAHREWNISERELESLVQWGLFTHDELRSTIATRYDRGLISFDARGTGRPACPIYVDGVLDVALDAQAVLDLARKRFTDAGGTILEGRAFKRLHMAERGPVASVFEVDGPGGPEFYRARLAVDTMGSVSPIAMGLNGGLPFDGVCPTAGTIIEGLDTDRRTGDVLVSIAPEQDGRQLIWEGFPGRRDETTVYLFYYDRTGPGRAREQRLLDLFERYFALLPGYKRMQPGSRHLKPVFGYIPSRHGRTGRTAARGLLCLGDSAAGQSPITFCGFGSFVRHIGRVAALVDFALKKNLLEEAHLKTISPHQANLQVAWVFSRFMHPWPGGDGAAVNRLMNVFCRALGQLGPEITVRFLQDRYTFHDYLSIMLTTAWDYPEVFALTMQALGLLGVARWAGDIAAFAADDALRHACNLLGPRPWKWLERRAAKRRPALALRLAASRTLWQTTR